MKRLHYRACTPQMHVVFNMFETAHMYEVYARWMFISYMYDSVNTALEITSFETITGRTISACNNETL